MITAKKLIKILQSWKTECNRLKKKYRCNNCKKGNDKYLCFQIYANVFYPKYKFDYQSIFLAKYKNLFNQYITLHYITIYYITLLNTLFYL